MLVLDQLEVDEPPQKAAECNDHERAGDQQAAAEKMLLQLRISQLGRAEDPGTAALGEESAHGASYRSAARRGRCGHCSTTVINGHSSAPTSGPTE